MLSHRPPLWPRRSGLRSGRLTKASEAAGRKTRCKLLPHAVCWAGNGQSWRQRPARLPSLRDWIGGWGGVEGGVSGAYSPSLRPVNQGTTSQTRRSGGGVETNSCQETTGDPATAAVWPRLRRSTRGAYTQLPFLLPWPPPPRAKSLPPPRALGLQRHVFTDLFCSIKLQRTPCHISLQRSQPQGQRLSLTLVKQGLH